MRAESDRRGVILTSEGKKRAAILEADPVNYLIANNYIKTLSDITSGKDNKLIIVPIESTRLVGAVSQIKEVFNK